MCRNLHPHLAIVSFFLILNTSSQLLADFTFFSERSAWESAVGQFSTEDFNSFTTDTSFNEASLAFAELTLNSSGAPASADLLADAPPYQFNPGDADIDGTTRINLGGLSSASIVTIDFDIAVTAFGFDILNYDVDNQASDIFIGGELVGTFPTSNQAIGFFGVIDNSSTFQSVEIRGDEDGFNTTFNAFDNVSFRSIPEPSSFALIAICCTLLLICRQVSHRAETIARPINNP